MSLGEVLLGACLVGASILIFWIALPREGLVRPFLRNDDVLQLMPATVARFAAPRPACGLRKAASRDRNASVGSSPDPGRLGSRAARRVASP
jgi:hypothetical protein